MSATPFPLSFTDNYGLQKIGKIFPDARTLKVETKGIPCGEFNHA